ncbi:MAG: histidine kinase, partial [Sphingomonas sp.]|nr:histidine kinase [Sphingomonas sp.]
MINGSLHGLRILVVEDDYYLATDTKAVIEGAGGKVVGPFGTAEEARIMLDASGADLAVIDINLGCWPVFDLARHLYSTNLPFLFATGYDQAVVPDDLSTVVRLEKPF